MRRETATKCIVFCTLIMLFSGVSNAEILNGDFENFINGPDFNTPADWDVVNYAAVVPNFVPQPIRGSAINWKIDINEPGLEPFEGNYFVVLSTGDIEPEPGYAKITQQIQAYAGETLSGVYFFGACDYLPYNDYATIKLLPQVGSPLRDIILIDIDIEDPNIGTYGSNDGWQDFEYTFSEAEAGSYLLEITVNDYQDAVYKSYMAVDSLRICIEPNGGDINRDCHVNFYDFVRLSAHWLEDVSDPNWYDRADLMPDGVIDANDLAVIHDNWLNKD